MKVLFGMPLRQIMGFVQSLLKLVGLNWTVQDFSTLSRRQKTLAVNIPCRGSRDPLHLLVGRQHRDQGRGRRRPLGRLLRNRLPGDKWHARKHDGTRRRVWRKIHLGIDEQTLAIRAVESSLANGCR